MEFRLRMKRSARAHVHQGIVICRRCFWPFQFSRQLLLQLGTRIDRHLRLGVHARILGSHSSLQNNVLWVEIWLLNRRLKRVRSGCSYRWGWQGNLAATLQMNVCIKNLVALSTTYPAFGNSKLVGSDFKKCGAGGATGDQAHRGAIVESTQPRLRGRRSSISSRLPDR